MLFHEVPKFHYVWHIIFQSRIANPRFNWTYPDEDFMRILKARFFFNSCINLQKDRHRASFIPGDRGEGHRGDRRHPCRGEARSAVARGHLREGVFGPRSLSTVRAYEAASRSGEACLRGLCHRCHHHQFNAVATKKRRQNICIYVWQINIYNRKYWQKL